MVDIKPIQNAVIHRAPHKQATYAKGAKEAVYNELNEWEADGADIKYLSSHLKMPKGTVSSRLHALKLEGKVESMGRGRWRAK